MALTTYKNLIVWQKSIELVTKIYTITQMFPREETFGLTSQIRRAAVSIPSNIAEGRLRGHGKQYKQFLRIAFGSCGEVQTQLEIAKNMGYSKDTTEVDFLIEEIMKMIHTLIGQQDSQPPNLPTS